MRVSNEVWKNKEVPPPSGRPIPLPALAVLVLLCPAVLVGCNGAQPQEPVATLQPEGSLNPPTIISGTPQRDLAAFNEADEQLSEAEWGQLEKWGPRPIWEKLNAAKRTRAAKPAADESDGWVHRSAAPVPAAPAPMPGGMPPGVDGPPSPAMLAPSRAETPAPPLPEPEPEVETTVMPDGKLRLVWVLRGYGGSNVTTTRDGGTTRRTVAVAPPDLEPLVAAIKANVGPGGSVTPLPKENTLVVTCDPAMKATLLNLLSKLDVSPRQVEITARIFEVSHDFDFQQGTELVLNRLAADNSQALISTFSARRFLDSIAGAAPAQGSVLKLMRTFADAGISADISFQLLSEAGLIKVVSSPRMTVAVGQTGYMLAGQELPIQSVNIVNNVLQTTTTYKPVGVQLYITPQAISDRSVKLHAISIVSSVSGFAPLPSLDGSGGGARNLLNPVIDSREAETQVTVNDGDTLVISGLRMVRTATRENKTPGLGDLPVLGWMFKNHRTQKQLTDLYFFVTPTML